MVASFVASTFFHFSLPFECLPHAFALIFVLIVVASFLAAAWLENLKIGVKLPFDSRYLY
jgi:hypothetical protein